MSQPATLFYIFNLTKAVRNFGKGGVIEALVQQGFRVIAFGVKPDQRDGIKKAFGDDVEFEELGAAPHSGMMRRIERLVTYIWRSRIDYQAVRIRHGYDGRFKAVLWVELLIGRLLQPLPVWFWERLQEFFSRWPKGDKLCEKYHPCGVLISNPIDTTANVLNWSKRRGLYTGAVIESWDNLTIRGGLYTYPHDMYVWGDLMKNEAANFHKLPAGRIQTTGLPSFDMYWAEQLYPTESSWRKQMQLPENVPVVSYATSPAVRQKSQDGYLDIMLNAVKNGKLPANTHFLVRIHREDDAAIYQRLKNEPHVRIQTTDASLEGMEPDMGRPMMLAATMRYSSVLVCLFSTTVLDAMANHTPSIACAFDPADENGGTPEIQKSIRRFLNDKHIKDMMAYEAVFIASSESELVTHLTSCLADKHCNAPAREKCLLATLGDHKGRSAQLFASTLKSRIQPFLARTGSP